MNAELFAASIVQHSEPDPQGRIIVKRALAYLLPLSMLAACKTPLETAPSPLGEAIIRSESGTEIGKARLYAQGDAVSINITLQIPGGSTVHAVHLHEIGDCSGPGFATAGGHLNPAGNQHGSLNPAGSHLGDLPNITLSPAGNGTASATLSGTRESALQHIFDSNGTAIVVHAAADDYRTDPSGSAGGRIGCGTFNRIE